MQLGVIVATLLTQIPWCFTTDRDVCPAMSGEIIRHRHTVAFGLQLPRHLIPSRHVWCNYICSQRELVLTTALHCDWLGGSS